MLKSWVGKLDSEVAFGSIFVVFFGAGFLLRPTPVWAMVYYAGFLPAFFALLWSRRGTDAVRDPGVVLNLAMMAWFGLTLVWGLDQTPARVAKYAFSIPVNFSIVVAGLVFFSTAEEKYLTGIYRVIPVMAAVNALIAIAMNLPHGFDVRLEGWAETRHPILGADVISVALVFCLRGWHAEARWPWRATCVAAGLLCVVFVLLTGSRGPFLAMAAAVVCYLIQVRPRMVVSLAAIAGLLAAAAVLFMPELVSFVTANVNRDTYRLAIWQETLALVRLRPFIGYGAANVHEFVNPWITFPHSIYMSSLYYAGAIGLGLVLALLGYCGWRAWKIDDRAVRAFASALMVVPVVGGLTDVGQFIKSPSEVWYILWLPIVAVLGLSRRTRAGKIEAGSS